jgi:hypothetical protein
MKEGGFLAGSAIVVAESYIEMCLRDVNSLWPEKNKEKSALFNT